MKPPRLRDALRVCVRARLHLGVSQMPPINGFKQSVFVIRRALVLLLFLFLPAYERTYPVYQSKRTPDAPVHLVVGGAGNHEGHAGERMEKAGIIMLFRGRREKWGRGTIRAHYTAHSYFSPRRGAVMRLRFHVCSSFLGYGIAYARVEQPAYCGASIAVSWRDDNRYPPRPCFFVLCYR